MTAGSGAPPAEDVWRRETPHVLTALLRRSGDFEACEDAVQEALLAAARQWPQEGVPDNPRGWLVRVASRRLIDEQRSRTASRDRELLVARQTPRDELVSPSVGDADPVTMSGGDDTLRLLVLCAHPSLTDVAKVALTLRAVAGLTTAQVAAVFLVPEATMAQRISRAKATIREAGARFPEPGADEVAERLNIVRHVLYLVFTAGHTSHRGATLVDVDLAAEAIRLTERLHLALPDDTETAGLLALMLLTHARTAARTDAHGDLVPLDEQDRGAWDAGLVARGTRLVEQDLPTGPVGPFQLQAAIAAVHDQATTAGDTDWLQIVMLYRLLEQVAASPAVSLGLAVAVGMAHGPDAGLRALDPLLADRQAAHNHRLHAARGHLLELAGDTPGAHAAYTLAAQLTQSIPEQRYLNRRAARLRPGQEPGD